jgi:hypothetical protein
MQRPASAPVSGEVSVDIKVVRATNQHSRVDPALTPMLQHLRFLNYSGFELLDTHDLGLAVSEESVFTVAGGRKVKIQLVSVNDTEAKLRIRMFNEDTTKLLDTTVSIHRNRSFIVAGPRFGEGVLILPVTARY